MNKLNQWLTLVANLSVVVGIVFLAVEMRQNTAAIQAQTRDAMTEKQTRLSEWGMMAPELARVISRVGDGGIEQLEPSEHVLWALFVGGNFREWENSYYQYQQGLFSREEFEPRLVRWRTALSSPSWRDLWEERSEEFAPSFRAEIDRIVAEVEQAQ